MKVVVLTTSYPLRPDDIAGAFVRDAVEAVRRAGVEVEVVSPAVFRHFGIAYRDGVVANLRREPWRLAFLPLFLAGFVRVARRAARDADLVHAHWLPTGLVGLATRKPLVLQPWGTDAEIARRVPWFFRPILRRASATIVASEALADVARRLGARDVRVIPAGVEIPPTVGRPDDPPHILFVGRLSEEKGILELVEAARDLPLVVVGDGPLRDRVPCAVGFVAPNGVGSYLERAAVVACPSRREGYGVVARQAMAYGRPVVVTPVGGLVDAVEDGVTGLVVPVGAVTALRTALERALGDEGLRARLGAAARVRAESTFGLDSAARSTIACYREVLGR